MTTRDLLRRLAARAGYRVTRLPPNRFDAMGVVLQRLRDVGFRPRVVIDAGANVGGWTMMARGIFADAEFHLIEPQPACHAALARLGGRLLVYPVAVTRPGVTEVQMSGTGSTGAWVLLAARPGSIT